MRSLPINGARLSELLEIAPNHPESHLLLAHLHAKQRRVEHYLLRLLQLEPTSSSALKLLALLRIENGAPATAVAILQPAAQANPEDAAILALFGYAHLASGNSASAERWLSRAATLAPSAEQIRFLLMTSRFALADLPALLAALPRMEPGNEEIRDRLQSHLQRGELVAAEKMLQEWSESRSESAAPVTLLGTLHWSQNRNEKGYAAYQKGRAIDIGYAPATLGLARIDLAAGRVEQAEAHYRAFLEGKPGDLQITMALAQLLERSGRRSQLPLLLQRADRSHEGVAALDRWLHDHPDDNAVRAALAIQLHQQGLSDKAVKHYQEILQRDPENSLAHNNLALIYDNRDSERALKHAERAYALNVESGSAADTLGWMLHRRGDHQRALPLLELAVAQGPDRPHRRWHLAAALAASGRLDEAQEQLRRAIASEKVFDERLEAEHLLQTLQQ